MSWSRRLEPALDRARRLALPAILLVALGLRLYRLGSANLWWDEALAVWAVRKGLVGATLWTASDVHPPLFFWTLWAWVQAFGETEFAMRLLPAVLGVFTVLVVHELGRIVGGPGVGLFAAALTAVSRFHVWWSQELRMYVMAGLLGTLSLALLLRWLRSMRLENPESESSSLLLAGSAAAMLGALYTVFLSAAWVLVQNLLVLGILVWGTRYRRAKMLWRWTGAQLAIAALVGLWLGLSWGRMSTWSVAEPVSPLFVARLNATLLAVGTSVEIERYAWLAVLPLVTAASGGLMLLLNAWRERDTDCAISYALLTLSIVIPPTLVYLSTLPRSLFYTPHIEARYLLPFAPAFWVLLAWSLSRIRLRWRALGTAVGLGLMAIALVMLPGYYRDRQIQDDYQTMVRAIASQAGPRDATLLDSGSRYPLFLYQYDRLPHQRPPFETVSLAQEPVTREMVDAWLAQNAERYDRIWLAEVDVNLDDPDRLVREGLAEQYTLAWSEGYGHNALLLFSNREDTISISTDYVPDQSAPPEAKALGLRGWELPVTTGAADAPLWITLYWDRAPEEACQIELVPESRAMGGYTAQRRSVATSPAAVPFRERIEFPIVDALPPGRYAVQLTRKPGAPVHLGSVSIVGTPNLPLPEGPLVALDALIDDSILLRGYTIQGALEEEVFSVRPGDSLVLDVYWEALQAPGRDWTVFTHLTGETYNPATAGPLWAQSDGVPGRGQWPTSDWREGDGAVERYIIAVGEDTPPGNYSLSFGLYDAATGERARIRQGDAEAVDQVVASSVINVRGD